VSTRGNLDWEIIIADDASSDDSVERTKAEFPVRVVRHAKRKGVSPTKHSAALEARGNTLVFLDGHSNPEAGAIRLLIENSERLQGRAIITPRVLALNTKSWTNCSSQVGHGYEMDLARLRCGWIELDQMRPIKQGQRELYESPAFIGCAMAMSKQLYFKLRGFDADMFSWGVEDLDLALKCWLMGYRILHDPKATVGHRFRRGFDTYTVPFEHQGANQLRMARKHLTQTVWEDWVMRARHRFPKELAGHPEGCWTYTWQVFEKRRASVESERSYLLSQRERDEFWYAQRFGLEWPRLVKDGTSKSLTFLDAATDPSPSPSPCTPDPGYAYAGALKNIANLIGGRATITTKDPALPCEPNATFYAHSAAYVSVNRPADPGPGSSKKWGQSGYIRRRLDGGTIKYAIYFEVRAGPDPAQYHFSYGTSPPPAGPHSYEVDLNSAAGRWSVTIDGIAWTNWTNVGWQNLTGTYISYDGEINDLNADMPGIPSSKCKFTACQYKVVGGVYTNAGLVIADLNSTDKAKWNYELISGTSFNIWDVNPS
jgi:GT2 family glycosyltransferase